MASNPIPFLTEEQYLDLERKAEYKSEYHDGRIVAMSGGSFAHSQVAVNLTSEFRAALRGRDCKTLQSDLKVRIPQTRSYVYPDCLVVCGPPRFPVREKDVVENPILVAEVLSNSTEKIDRSRKFAKYRTIGSLRAYMLVSQFEPLVELFSRQPDGEWSLSIASG